MLLDFEIEILLLLSSDLLGYPIRPVYPVVILLMNLHFEVLHEMVNILDDVRDKVLRLAPQGWTKGGTEQLFGLYRDRLDKDLTEPRRSGFWEGRSRHWD